MKLTLCDIVESNREECLGLAVLPSQRSLVAPNSNSLAWAAASPSCVPLGILLDGSMVGFAMFEPRGPTVFSLHRFMIDAAHQQKGLGLASMRLVMGRMVDLGAKTIYLSFRPENHAAKALYEKLEFAFHVEEPDGEVVYRYGPPGDLGIAMNIPPATRPSLSGYVESGKLLPWSWVDVRMAAARSYWISTISRGFPSSRPVWGVWHDCYLCFSTGSAIAKNISRDTKVQVNLESADEVVIVEGNAMGVTDEDLDFWVSEYKQKYNWDMPRTTEGVYRVYPTRVLAWICDPSGQDGGVMFANTATAWQFVGGSK